MSERVLVGAWAASLDWEGERRWVPVPWGDRFRWERWIVDESLPLSIDLTRFPERGASFRTYVMVRHEVAHGDYRAAVFLLEGGDPWGEGQLALYRMASALVSVPHQVARSAAPGGRRDQLRVPRDATVRGA